MKFFRQHSSLILKLFANQIGMTFFGLVLSMAVGLMGNDWLKLAVSAFAILFYLCLIYSVMWEAGASDIVRIEAGRAEKIPFYPVKIALWASVPNLLLAALLLIFGLMSVLFSLEWATSVYAILHILLGLFEAMYVGLFSFIIDGLSGAAYVLVPCVLYVFSSLPMILVSAGAYALGARNIHLFGARNSNKK